MLDKSLESVADKTNAALPKIHNLFGELKLFQGILDQARDHLEKGIAHAEDLDDEISQIENAITMTRCFIAEGSILEAAEEAEEIIKCGRILDEEHLEISGRLVLAETYLADGKSGEARKELEEIEAKSRKNFLTVTGNTQRLFGLVAASEEDSKSAIHSFRRALTIYETCEDLYHSALMHYHLGDVISGHRHGARR